LTIRLVEPERSAVWPVGGRPPLVSILLPPLVSDSKVYRHFCACLSDFKEGASVLLLKLAFRQSDRVLPDALSASRQLFLALYDMPNVFQVRALILPFFFFAVPPVSGDRPPFILRFYGCNGSLLLLRPGSITRVSSTCDEQSTLFHHCLNHTRSFSFNLLNDAGFQKDSFF